MGTPWRYWGKAGKPENGRVRYHLLVYHALDVAAVGEAYLRRHPRFLRFLSASLGLSEQVTLAWVVFLLALHDLGKFAVTFQGQRPDLLSLLQGGRETLKSYTVRHDTLGACVWRDSAQLRPMRRALRQPSRAAIPILIDAVTGHHGQPPNVAANVALERHFDLVDLEAAAAFVTEMQKLLLPDAAMEAWLQADGEKLLEGLRLSSWWIAGWAVLADWVGSNTNWFRYCETVPEDGELERYWSRAQAAANTALDAVGVLPVPSEGARTFTQLFPAIAHPTPLQAAAEGISLAPGPQLFILEDVTGAGKTEAALMLAHRLLAAGEADGLYFGLPTQATANQMFERVGQACEQLFSGPEAPSVVLAHGARDLSQRFRESVLPVSEDEADARQADESAGARCTAWLADKRKAALLANVGVGTVDQVLSAVLHARHQSLRVLGLFRKVLIIDEVHACDTYMLDVLAGVLELHRAAGGSAILLSATLPQERRQQLSAIYNRESVLREDHFPLLTHVSTASVVEQPVPTRQAVTRRVDVEWLSSERAAVERVLSSAGAGQAVVWVRNTVRDAMAAYRQLKAHHPDIQLFHARYVLGDRLRIEQAVLERLGKRGRHRQGYVLVSTQVFQESLDADADDMVSDIAPIDLVVQRAGRLRRHRRDVHGALLAEGLPDQRGVPRLAILSPPPDARADAGWLKPLLPGAAAVYPAIGQLWLTARHLRETGGWQMPDDARALIRAVFDSAQCTDLPEGLQQVENTQVGLRFTAQAIAQNSRINLEAGYTLDPMAAVNWWDDTRAVTRLGEATVTLQLLRWERGVLSDFWPDPDPIRAAGLSRVSVREAIVNAEADPSDPALRQALAQWRTQRQRALRWVLLVPVSRGEDGAWHGFAARSRDGKAREMRIRYCEEVGLECTD
jgi:CRISPR-associated endonuclease/helicase Cas3